MEHVTLRLPNRLKNALDRHTGNKSEYIRRLIEDDMEGKIRKSERINHVKLDRTKRLGEILTDFAKFYPIVEPVNLTIHPLAHIFHPWQPVYLQRITQKHRIHISYKPRQIGWDALHCMIAHYFLSDKHRVHNILYLAPNEQHASNIKTKHFDRNLSFLADEFNYRLVSNKRLHMSNSIGNSISFRSPDDWLLSTNDIKQYDVVFISEFAFLSGNFESILQTLVNSIARDPTKYLFMGSSVRTFKEQDLQYTKSLATLQVPNELKPESDTDIGRYIIDHPHNISKKVAQGRRFEKVLAEYCPALLMELLEPEYADLWERIGKRFK